MKNFRTFNLAVEFYRQTKCLKLPTPLRDQLARAALSIPLNLAEGRGKPTLKDQIRFFNIAMGSLRECEAILEIADQANTQLGKALDTLGAHLHNLIRHAAKSPVAEN